MELKKTTKYYIKEKNLRIFNDKIVNEDGEIVDIIAMFKKAYKDTEFELSATAKTEEKFNLSE